MYACMYMHTYERAICVYPTVHLRMCVICVCMYIRTYTYLRTSTVTYIYVHVQYCTVHTYVLLLNRQHVLRFPPPYCTRLQQAACSRLYHWPNSLTCVHCMYVACVVRLADYWASVTVLAMFNTVRCQWWAILYAERVHGRGMCRSEWGAAWSMFHTLLCLCIWSS